MPGFGLPAKHGRRCRLRTGLQCQRQRRQLVSAPQARAAAVHTDQHPRDVQPPDLWQRLRPEPNAAEPRTLCATVLEKHTWLRHAQCRNSTAADHGHDGELEQIRLCIPSCKACTVYFSKDGLSGRGGSSVGVYHCRRQRCLLPRSVCCRPACSGARAAGCISAGLAAPAPAPHPALPPGQGHAYMAALT